MDYREARKRSIAKAVAEALESFQDSADLLVGEFRRAMKQMQNSHSWQPAVIGARRWLEECYEGRRQLRETTSEGESLLSLLQDLHESFICILTSAQDQGFATDVFLVQEPIEFCQPTHQATMRLAFANLIASLHQFEEIFTS